MFGRIFGRGKDDQDEAVCYECGRTLLAGEWTQTVIDEGGQERLICSLCGQSYQARGTDAVAAAPAPANNGRVRETRVEAPSEVFHDEPVDDAPPAAAVPAATTPARDTRAESDAFWQALKDKDAEIEELRGRLERAEAERQELAGRFARTGSGEDRSPASLTGDSSVPGERTWGETPAEFAAEMAALRAAEAGEPQAAPAPAGEAAAAVSPTVGSFEPEPLEPEPVAAESPSTSAVFGDEVAPAEAAAVEAVALEAIADAPVAGEPAAEASDEAPETVEAVPVAAVVFEDTQPIPAITDDMVAAAEDDEGESTGQIPAAAVAAAEPAEPEPTPAEVEAAAASLTLLQRGVDLLNVSQVPRKISETNEQLGLPHVHVGFDGSTAGVTFMWTMGWYRFIVDLDSGEVSLDDRGYEDRTDLPPNAGVRADGTVQLAPAQISRAAAQRTPVEAQEGSSRPAPAGAPAGAPESPRAAAQKPPEILSKSLLGQRSDDETASWEQTQARDFDWDR